MAWQRQQAVSLENLSQTVFSYFSGVFTENNFVNRLIKKIVSKKPEYRLLRVLETSNFM